MFILLAVWFLFGPSGADIPIPEAAAVTAADIDPAPRRSPVLTDPPVVKLNGFERDCQDCHRILNFERDGDRPRYQHTDIVLKHGLNDRCVDCHAVDNRNRLAVDHEVSVPFTESSRLCAKCHGPTYRDWDVGVHGKSVGAWDPESPDRKRFDCVQCHDPHAPAYEAMAPLPGPNTLRMGKRHPAPEHFESPLMRHVKQDGAEGHAPKPAAGGGH